MGINVTIEFLPSATVRVTAYIKNDKDALVDPTGVTIDIYDPDGTKQVDDVSMSSSVTGIYDYYYHKGVGEAAMDTGRWRGKVIVVDGSGSGATYSPQSFSFKVI